MGWSKQFLQLPISMTYYSNGNKFYAFPPQPPLKKKKRGGGEGLIQCTA